MSLLRDIIRCSADLKSRAPQVFKEPRMARDISEDVPTAGPAVPAGQEYAAWLLAGPLHSLSGSSSVREEGEAAA
jgi:hypothetical protein